MVVATTVGHAAPLLHFFLGFLVHAGRNEAILKARPVVEPRARRESIQVTQEDWTPRRRKSRYINN